MNRALTLVIFLSISACSSKSDEKSSRDYLAESKIESSPKPQQGELGERIMGVWTDGNSENATFEIGKDSILYVENLTSYKYFLSGDSIKIMYDSYDYIGRLSFKGDTLVMESEEGASKFWKFKN